MGNPPLELPGRDTADTPLTPEEPPALDVVPALLEAAAEEATPLDDTLDEDCARDEEGVRDVAPAADVALEDVAVEDVAATVEVAALVATISDVPAADVADTAVLVALDAAAEVPVDVTRDVAAPDVAPPLDVPAELPRDVETPPTEEARDVLLVPLATPPLDVFTAPSVHTPDRQA